MSFFGIESQQFAHQLMKQSTLTRLP